MEVFPFERGIQQALVASLDLSLSKEYDLTNSRVIEWLTFLVSEKRLLGFMLSPPCTTFSIMRRPRLRSAEVPYGFEPGDPQTATGTALAQRSFQVVAEIGMQAVGFWRHRTLPT